MTYVPSLYYLTTRRNGKCLVLMENGCGRASSSMWYVGRAMAKMSAHGNYTLIWRMLKTSSLWCASRPDHIVVKSKGKGPAKATSTSTLDDSPATSKKSPATTTSK
jgi:hypothetical protein